jgi:hypothetical protein
VTREVEKECSSVRRTPGLTSSVCTLVAGGTSITLNTGTYVGGADSSKEGWDIGLDPLKVDVADVRGSRRSDAAVVVDENVGVEKSDVPRVLSIPRILGGNLPEEADVVGANDAAEVTVDLAEMASKEPEVCPVCHLVACTVKDGPLSHLGSWFWTVGKVLGREPCSLVAREDVGIGLLVSFDKTEAGEDKFVTLVRSAVVWEILLTPGDLDSGNLPPELHDDEVEERELDSKSLLGGGHSPLMLDPGPTPRLSWWCLYRGLLSSKEAPVVSGGTGISVNYVIQIATVQAGSRRGRKRATSAQKVSTRVCE